MDVRNRKSSIPVDDLRQRIAEALAAAVKAHTLPAAASALGLAEGDGAEAHHSKRLYVLKRLQTWKEKALLELAQRVIDEYGSRQLEDVLSELRTPADQRLSTLTRRDILRAMDGVYPLFGEADFYEGLEEIAPPWHIAPDPQRPFGSLREEVERHYLRNDDWTNSELLEICGALKCSQARFFALLEVLLHPLARRGAPQQQLVEKLNAMLKADGFAAIVIANESGHPIYAIKRLGGGVAGAPKNLIFASIGEKPEIVLSDAINNDVQITRHADKCLIYDRPLPSTGLRWVEMAKWWQGLNAIPDLESARKALGKRLLASVRHGQSPAELALFKTYHEAFGPTLKDALPALIPQVYLHYDPLTRAQRGGQALLIRQRMDFLMLLEGNVRIVIEIDGKHHYADDDTASPARYADMVREDRALRLRGYEVYRFGAAEFADVQPAADSFTVGPKSKQAIVAFFTELFRRHAVSAP